MLKTVSGPNSLIPWVRNVNDSQIGIEMLGGNEKFMQSFYAELFHRTAEELKKGPDVFVQLWSGLCDDECKKIERTISTRLTAAGADFTKAAVKMVSDKFRGNAGEIMFETIFAAGLVTGLGLPGTYEPVDPAHEQYVDATTSMNGLPVGIQIKNYGWKGNIHREIFTKAAAMSDIWLRHDNMVPADRIADFISTPCQHIVATCKQASDLLLENYSGCVVFHGPDWFDKLGIQGNRKNKVRPYDWLFEQTAVEIERF